MDDPVPLEQAHVKPEAPLIGADGNVFNLHRAAKI
jgi:hypothetical protein